MRSLIQILKYLLISVKYSFKNCKTVTNIALLGNEYVYPYSQSIVSVLKKKNSITVNKFKYF